MATNFSPSCGSSVLNQFPSILMFGIKGIYISASGAIQGHHGPLVNNFLATVIRETNILVIFNVFMKYSALISSQNMMFNDEMYNNGGCPYFDF